MREDGDMKKNKKITKKEKKIKISIDSTIAFFLCIVTLIIALHMHTSSQISSIQNSIYKEMKDFHGRLCVLDKKYTNDIEKEFKTSYDN
jgi:hypothetical protein